QTFEPNQEITWLWMIRHGRAGSHGRGILLGKPSRCFVDGQRLQILTFLSNVLPDEPPGPVPSAPVGRLRRRPSFQNPTGYHASVLRIEQREPSCKRGGCVCAERGCVLDIKTSP